MNPSLILQKISVCACLFLLGIMSLLAQSGRGSIGGTVTDPSGAIVPGASVVAISVERGTKLTTVTSGGGVYSFVSVAPGAYDVAVTRDGFQTNVQKNVRVSVDQASTLNVTLRAGGANETVTVDASTASLIDSSNSTVGQLISAQTIDRVPLVTRDVYELVQLSAGVLPANGTPNAADTVGIFNQRSLADVSSYTVNGALQGSSYYMLDGSPIGIAENNAATIIPAFQIPEDGVEEFRVETQNTPASYASGGGGVISLVTKSGTNAFHGDAFGYFRPNALAANDFFFKRDNPGVNPPDFHRYQEGGAISGPIIKDKLFFFGDYEATQQESLEVGSFTVPTAAERTGDFSADSLTIYNPLVADSANVDDSGQILRQPFANNIIPTEDLNPIALKFADKFPLPNHADDGNPQHTNNYKKSGLDPQRAQKFDVRVDYTLNDKNRIFGRFSYGRLSFGNADLYGNGFDPFYYVNLTNTRNAIVGYDRTLSSTSVLQLRASFTRHFENQTGDPAQNNFDITSVGFPQSLADQVVFKQLPVFNFGATSPVGGTSNYDTFIFASENSDLSATITKVFGKHELSLGFEYQKMFMNIGQPPAPAGSYGFDTTATNSTTYTNDGSGSDFASFLLGQGTAPGNEGGNFTKDIFAAEANPYYAAFGQDSYHITPRLTFNLGLRWEIFGGRTERHNRQEYFDPNLAYTLNGVSLTGGEVFANADHRSPFATNLTDFAPRASFAWQTAPHVVFRGGAGIYYGPSSEMVANPSLNGDGFSSSTDWNATQFNENGNTVILNSLSNPFPSGVVQLLGSSLGAATNIGTGLGTVLHSAHTTTTYNFNLGVELEFPGNTIFSLGYVGSRGLYLPLGTVDLNQLPLQTIAQYGPALCVDPGTPGCVMVPNTWKAIQPAQNQFYGSDTVPQYLALEQYPQFSNSYGSGVAVNGYPGGDSEFSSLQAKVEKHMSHHISSIASFTWGKIMTNDSQPPFGFVGYRSGAPQDAKNLNLEHAVSAQDVKLQFNWQISYDLPIGRGRALNLESPIANSLLGGWTLNSIAYLSDGVPIAAPSGTNDPYFNQRVDLTCNPAANARRTSEQWFNYTCFSQPNSQFVPGTAPAFLSSVRTDGAHQVDLSLYKNFALGHERNLRLEVASFNVTNTVQYGYPNVFWNPAVASDPTVMAGFGQINSAANQPRQFQFGAKFAF